MCLKPMFLYKIKGCALTKCFFIKYQLQLLVRLQLIRGKSPRIIIGKCVSKWVLLARYWHDIDEYFAVVRDGFDEFDGKLQLQIVMFSNFWTRTNKLLVLISEISLWWESSLWSWCIISILDNIFNWRSCNSILHEDAAADNQKWWSTVWLSSTSRGNGPHYYGW